MTIVFDANQNLSTKAAMQGQEQGRGLEFLSRKSKHQGALVLSDQRLLLSNNIAQTC